MNDTPTTAMLPRAITDRLGWLGVVLTGLTVVYSLGLFWRLEPGNSDRFLILVGALWVAYRELPRWRALPVSPWPILGTLLILVAGVALWPPTRLISQIGPRPVVLWWSGAAFVGMLVGLMLARYGYSRLRAAAFSIVVLGFAMPIPNRILLPLQELLQSVTTFVAYHSFQLVGMTVVRSGFVLEMTGGKLGVEEACSGVRSLTALTAIAAFIAYFRGFGPLRGTALVALSVPIVCAVNVLRVVLSGFIQHLFGSHYIRDDWHEALGFAMIPLGLGLIYCIATFIGPAASSDDGPPPAPHPDLANTRLAWLPTIVMVIVSAGTVAAFGAGYLIQKDIEEKAPIEEIRKDFPGWNSKDIEVPKVVMELLRPDKISHRLYQNNIGQEAYVWVMYWGSTSTMIGYHHPDVCWGNKGFEATTKWLEQIAPPACGAVNVTAREYKTPKDRQVVFYWTQEGKQIWTQENENAAVNDMLTNSTGGHKWVGILLGATQPAQPRLQVIIIVPNTGSTARKDAMNLSKLIAEELYRVCPWAKPE
ncbi:MAG: exosortase/archaeosortase family protein [Fimbriiglobus sp.]